jgi:hypothetical protein
MNGVGFESMSQGAVAFAYRAYTSQNAASSPSVPTAPPPLATSDSDQNALLNQSPLLLRTRMEIQGFFELDPGTTNARLQVASQAGFMWVKYQINWKELENRQGQYLTIQTLDSFLDFAQRYQMNVLFGVVRAPDWTRAVQDTDGPPSDYNNLGSFVGFLAQRYQPWLENMKIAFEIWNEPNTRAEWNGSPISAKDYVALLSTGYRTIKSVDARYLVVSAGLEPTGINDGVQAFDDKAFLREMYGAGLSEVSDAVGIHPYGWANPPTVRCCRDLIGPPVYNDDPHFFFLNTIEDYRAIQLENGDLSKPQWATEFGWGTTDSLGEVPAEMPYIAYTSSDQQARYIVAANQTAQAWDFMGPMFLWNLNMGAYFLSEPDQSAYSIMLGLSSPRPALSLLRSASKKKIRTTPNAKEPSRWCQLPSSSSSRQISLGSLVSRFIRQNTPCLWRTFEGYNRVGINSLIIQQARACRN